MPVIDATEQTHFAQLSDHWWDKHGPLAGLHAYTPARLRFITQAVGEVAGLRVLDVGCGGGLLCEPLARLGARVTGLDGTAEAIAAARDHAGALPITYCHGALTDLPKKQVFDLVIASEVLEHVEDKAEFIAQLCARTAPKGQLILTTLNRTLPARLLAIWAAENLLGLAPRGTHHYDKFITPAELATLLADNGFTVRHLSGARYYPLTREMQLHPSDLSINYLLWASR